MRIAIVSDIHGNRTALEAVMADLRITAPDEVLFGGDLADSGSSPVDVLDCVRDRGWRGVCGNTDDMLVRPESLEAFAAQSKAPPALWDAIRAIAAATREALGEERLAWLSRLPAALRQGDLAVVHARPGDCWRAPAAAATEVQLEEIYRELGAQTVVYGHTHLPSVRRLSGTPQFLLNCGSAGLPYDGDPRASYLLLDEDVPTIRRVEYDMERELQLLAGCGLPGAAWTAKTLRASGPTMP